MSAIFGIIGTEEGFLKPEWETTLLGALRHRGPDGLRSWQQDGVLLGHAALHVTPESCFERQPLEYRHWVLVADARLDNRAELFGQLGVLPSERSQATDGLLIAMAFEKWGDRCPEFLVGDFAFAIWDKQARRLFCAKDHVGVRQLFYHQSAGVLVFASEIPAITRLDFVPRALNLDAIARYVSLSEFLDDQAASTMLSGICRLLPAHTLSWGQGQLGLRQYWGRNPEQKIVFKDSRDYGYALRELLQQAVDDRMRTSFPVGAMLSGGLDSSTIVCLAARRLAEEGKKLHTASSVLPLQHGGVEEDERFFIDSVLTVESNLDHRWVTASGMSAFDRIEEAFERHWSPPTCFYYMDRALSESLVPCRVRVVLDGYGGDATVSNDGALAVPTLLAQKRYASLLKLMRMMGSDWPDYARVLRKYVLRPLAPQPLIAFSRLFRRKKAVESFAPSRAPLGSSRYFRQRAEALCRDQEAYFEANDDHFSSIWDTGHLWFVGEDDHFQHQQQEWAYPLLDKRIIEFLWASPPEQFLYRGHERGYVRQAMEDVLPPAVLWRPDKIAYSPDFKRRMINESPAIAAQLEKQLDGPHAPLLDLREVISRLSGLRGGWETEDGGNGNFVNAACHMVRYLEWMNKKCL